MLDLREVADEWQALLDEIEELHEHDNTQDDEAAEEIKADCKKFEDLCDELGVSPVGPATLLWWSENHDSSLVPEDEFEDHAREMAESIGAIDPDANWPLNCIDWERAAEELQTDYTSVEYDGATYYYRS